MLPAKKTSTSPVRLSTLISSVAFAVVVGSLLTVAVSVTQWPISSDFTKFYASAQLLAHGQDMYASIPLDAYGPLPPDFTPTQQELHGNLNPPQVTLLLLPFAALTIDAALQVWAIMSLGLGLLSCMLLWYAVNPPPYRLASLFWLCCAFFLYIPTLAALWLGQLTFLTFLLLVLAWQAVRDGHEITAGILIGLALSIKLFIGLVIIYFLIRRRWPIVVWAGLVFGATTLIGVLAVGWQSYVRFEAVLGSVTWYGAGMNASYASVSSRLFGGSNTQPLLDLPVLGRWVTNAASVASLAVLLVLAWPRTNMRQNQVDALGLGMAFCFSLLISPLGWGYYFPILLVAVYPSWRQNMYDSKAARWLIVVAVVLSAVPALGIKPTELQGWGVLLSSTYFFALLACACGLAVAYNSCRQRADGLDARCLS